jgi:glycosyltransferase involved in cell wall biosynthesis
MLALSIYDHNQTPFTVTWHGSEIHSIPRMNAGVNRSISKICNTAAAQFFVSSQLMNDAFEQGFNVSRGHVLYNAVDMNEFKRYPIDIIKSLKRVNGIGDGINIAFIGGLVPIKNVLLLPQIFRQIKDKLSNTAFYFVGDGGLKEKVAGQCETLKLKVSFLGDRQPSEMPQLINCFDLILLPSINEGLPLIVLESIACNVPIIASKVGGIPEVIDIDYLVEHGNGFVNRFANKAIEVLNKSVIKLKLPEEISWEKAASKEIAVYEQILEQA